MGIQNEIKKINNDISAMKCLDTKSGKDIWVYFNTSMIDVISQYDVEWRSWTQSGEKFIGANSKLDGKTINLKRIIGTQLFVDSNKTTLIHNDYNDLRNQNFFPYDASTFYTTDVQTQLKVLRNSLSTIEDLLKSQENTVDTANTDSIKVYEQNDQVIVIDLNKENFILTLDIEYAMAIAKKLNS